MLAAVSQADGTREVGVYYYAKSTGCLENFQFASNAPFWYLISRTGTVTGLQCTGDALGAHLEAISATPSPTSGAPSRIKLTAVSMLGRKAAFSKERPGGIAISPATSTRKWLRWG